MTAELLIAYIAGAALCLALGIFAAQVDAHAPAAFFNFAAGALAAVVVLPMIGMY